MTTPRQLALVTAVLALGVSGCGISNADDVSASSEPSASAQPTTPPAPLPQRRPGLIEIDGSTRGSLTAEAVDNYQPSGVRTSIQVANRGEDTAFAALCAGQVDLVDSARGVSDSELAACTANGLDLVQFQIASDAVVLAIKSESDVGGDCLAVDQVEEIYRAGSQIASWSDVGMGEVPLTVGGPDVENNAFGFFGAEVLQAPEPSMTYLRSDYHAFENDQGTRGFVVGAAKDESSASKLPARQARLTSTRRVVQDAEAALPALMSEVTTAEAERAKGIRDVRPAADQVADQTRVDVALAALDAARRDLDLARTARATARANVKRSTAAQERRDEARGHVAYFRFSYYETFEDQLRPFEIRGEGGMGCVFPSQWTITGGQYPLARQLLVTTTRDALRRADVRSFLTHHLESSRAMAEDARMVPLPEPVVTTQLGWLEKPGDAPGLEPDDQSSGEEPGTPEAEVPAR